MSTKEEEDTDEQREADVDNFQDQLSHSNHQKDSTGVIKSNIKSGYNKAKIQAGSNGDINKSQNLIG